MWSLVTISFPCIMEPTPITEMSFLSRKWRTCVGVSSPAGSLVGTAVVPLCRISVYPLWLSPGLSHNLSLFHHSLVEDRHAVSRSGKIAGAGCRTAPLLSVRLALTVAQAHRRFPDVPTPYEDYGSPRHESISS